LTAYPNLAAAGFFYLAIKQKAESRKQKAESRKQKAGCQIRRQVMIKTMRE